MVVSPMQTLYSVLFLLLLNVTTQAGELRCLRPGAPVLSLYKDTRYYPGRVESLGESIDVVFENGKQQSYNADNNEVIVDDVPDVDELFGGSRVLARRPSSTSFEPGFVNGSVEGVPRNDTFVINYDSGDNIARNIAEIRLATKPTTCMNEKGIYIGCFQNVLNNYLTNYYPVNPTDVATCNWACFSRGFNFAGLQNGTWCFCGNRINDSLKVEDNECNIACRDSREDVCGGYERMTVYWTGAESSINSSETQSESDDTATKTPEQSTGNGETPSYSDCSDIYDSSQCNEWAENSRCIEDPDWMIANCKRSCYACAYDDHDTSSSSQSYTYNNVDQSQSPSTSPYQPSTRTQSSVDYQSSPQSTYQQNYNPSSEDIATQPSTKKSSDLTPNNPKSASYLGCFKDSTSSHDLEYLTEIRPLSIRACITKCKSMRFPYAGLQSSTSCYCGLHYGKYGQLAHEDCDTPCEADSSEMCGGILKNSLYNTGFALKFKTTSDAYTRKIVPYPPKYFKPFEAYRGVYGETTSRSMLLSSPPSVGYQSPQSYSQTYSQRTSPSYNPAVYSEPTSIYNRPVNPPHYTDNHPTYHQVNGYNPAPAPRLSYQGGNLQHYSAQVSTTSKQSPVFSPTDSSSYGWRETFVKLRALEQERSARLSRKNWRSRKHTKKSRKLKSSWKKISQNTIKHHRKKYNVKKESKIVHNSLLRNSTKQLKVQEENSWHPSSVNEKNSQKSGTVFHSSPKKVAEARKSYAKPGIFLRKKASRNSGFLAFLPREVAKSESLLESVYNMLSQMLKNLRKHKKSTKTSHSMKTLKQYLKLPGSKHQDTKTVRIVPKEKQGAKHQESSLRTHGSRFRDHRKSRNHPLKGQKQLRKDYSVKIRPVSNSWQWPGDQGTYLPHDNVSSTSNHHLLPGTREVEKPSYVPKVVVRPKQAVSRKGVTSFPPSTPKILENKVHLANLSENKNNSTWETPQQRMNSFPSSFPSKNSPNQSSSSRNSSIFTESQSASNVSATRDQWNDRVKNERVGEHSQTQYNKHTGRLSSMSSKNDNNVDSKDGRKYRQNATLNKVKLYKEPFKMSKSGKGISVTSNVKPKEKQILKIDEPLVKEINTKETNDALKEQSDEDIISAIVQLLENKKDKRKEKQHKRKKRTMKRHHGNSAKKSKRISKKDHVQRFSGNDDDNLMEEEQDYIKLEKKRS